MRIFVVTIVLFAMGCSSTWQPGQVSSPDNTGVATVTIKERHGIQLPGPEPAETLAKWVRLTVTMGGKQVYDSGYEEVGVNQSIGACDIQWSTDSAHLAYRLINTIRVIEKDGKADSFNVVHDNSLVSSLKWIGDRELLVVSKLIDEPLDMFGGVTHYHGYLAKSKSVQIARLNLDTGTTVRYEMPVNSPTFLFCSIDFVNLEISPYSNRVAFSDGNNLCIYDDDEGKLIAQIEIPQKPAPKPSVPPDYPPEMAEVFAELSSEPAQLEGVWWQTKNRVIIGVGLLGFPAKSFYVFDIPSNTLNDETANLLPAWEGSMTNQNYRNPDWYKDLLK